MSHAQVPILRVQLPDQVPAAMQPQPANLTNLEPKTSKNEKMMKIQVIFQHIPTSSNIFQHLPTTTTTFVLFLKILSMEKSASMARPVPVTAVTALPAAVPVTDTTACHDSTMESCGSVHLGVSKNGGVKYRCHFREGIHKQDQVKTLILHRRLKLAGAVLYIRVPVYSLWLHHLSKCGASAVRCFGFDYLSQW